MACATIYWGNHYGRFFDVFIDYGAVVDIRPLIDVEIGERQTNRQSGYTGLRLIADCI